MIGVYSVGIRDRPRTSWPSELEALPTVRLLYASKRLAEKAGKMRLTGAEDRPGICEAARQLIKKLSTSW